MTLLAPKSVTNKFKWIIKNVTRENIMKHDDKNKFKTQFIQTRIDNCLIEWCLKFCYNDKDESAALYFFKKKSDDDKYLLNLRVNMRDYAMKFQRNLGEINLNWGWPCFIELGKLLDPTRKYIDEENCLTLNIEAKFTEILDDDGSSISSDTLPELYSQFFNNKTLSDLKFKCSDGVELPVHQIVLAANSPVFMKMFTKEMEEKKTKMVIFEDISSDTMKAALEYVYTDKLSFTDVESAIKVLYVAEKYEIPELKQHCIGELMTKVDKENVLEIFEAADLYNVRLLEVKCLSIITENYEDIKSTEKYDMLEKPLIKKITDEFSQLLAFGQNFSIDSSM